MGKTSTTAGVAAIIVLLSAFPAKAAAGAPAPVRVSAVGCSIEIDGDSTLRKYSATSHVCRAIFGIDESDPLAQTESLEDLIRGGHIKTFELAVPVETLKSGDSHLDDHMWKALKTDRFKQIRFHMTSYRVLPAPDRGHAFSVAMQGTLRVAGVVRPIELAAAATPITGGFQVGGATNLLMTDFQITPPTLFFGAIKTANPIAITFGVEMRPAVQ